MYGERLELNTKTYSISRASSMGGGELFASSQLLACKVALCHHPESSCHLYEKSRLRSPLKKGQMLRLLAEWFHSCQLTLRQGVNPGFGGAEIDKVVAWGRTVDLKRAEVRACRDGRTYVIAVPEQDFSRVPCFGEGNFHLLVFFMLSAFRVVVFRPIILWKFC